jgi:hypothetical protein
MITSRSALKQWFSRGKKPTEAQFAALIDSFWHKEDEIPVGQTGWRPSDRPKAPTFVRDEQAIYFLFGVQEHGLNDYAFRLTANGGYEVDWGDGVIEAVKSDATAEHKYDFYSLNNPVGSEGYKWVWIKATPAIGGNITVIDISQYRPSWQPPAAATSVYVPQVFEIYLQAPEVTSIPFTNSFNYLRNLDLFIYKGSNKITHFTAFLMYCSKLKVLETEFKSNGIYADFMIFCMSFNQKIVIEGTPSRMQNFMSYCYSFNSALAVDTKNTEQISNFMLNCFAMNKPRVLDLAGATAAIGATAFSLNTSMTSLRLLNMGLIHAELSVANSAMDIDAIMALLQDLPDRSSTTTGTFTMIETPASVQIEAKQIAQFTDKNWTVVI